MYSQTKKIYGLLGFPLSHSFSPGFFKEKFSRLNLPHYVYKTFEIENANDIELLKKNEPQLAGFNVTIPHKANIIPFLDELSPEAKQIGAVNVVKCKDNKWIGYNTDYIGFRDSLMLLLNPNKTYSAYILGTGGASKAAAFAFKELNIAINLVSRTKDLNMIAYEDLGEINFEKHLIFVNTTPLGMHPKMNTCPDIPYEKLNQDHILFDMVYNPEMTLFLKKGKAKGCKIKNGLEMLQIQAEASWKIWEENTD